MRRCLLVLILGASAAWSIGCSGSAPPPRSPPQYLAVPDLPPRPAFDPDTVRAADDGRVTQVGSDIQLTGTLAAAKAIRAEGYSVQHTGNAMVMGAHRFLYGSPSQRALAAYGALPAIDASPEPTPAAKVEREAQLAIVVKDFVSAAAAVLATVKQLEGSVVKDDRTTYGSSGATLILRVPATALDVFLEGMGAVGEIKSRRVTTIDATFEHKDVEILVANLEAAQARYRDLLQHATDPGQILAVERELERVRTDLERIKGRLDFLRDRVAYATVAIALVQAASPEPPTPPGAYQPIIATGVYGLALVDVRQNATNAYAGAGLSLRFPRSTGDSGRGFALDVDVMRACCGATPERSDWAYDVLAGLDLFSENLENGRRRWLNPFLGLRVGIAQTEGWIDFAAAAVIGLEIFKTRAFVIDAQARLMALVGNPDGPHAAAQPMLGVDLGF